MTSNRPIRKVRHAKRVRNARMGHEISMRPLVQRIASSVFKDLLSKVMEKLKRNLGTFMQAQQEAVDAHRKLRKAYESEGNQ